MDKGAVWKVSPANVARPGVSSVIIGVYKTSHLEDNLKTVDWAVTHEEMARLDEAGKPERLLYPYWYHEVTKGRL